MNEFENFWSDLIFKATDGKADEMIALKKFDVMDFFAFIESKGKKNG